MSFACFRMRRVDRFGTGFPPSASGMFGTVPMSRRISADSSPCARSRRPAKPSSRYRAYSTCATPASLCPRDSAASNAVSINEPRIAAIRLSNVESMSVSPQSKKASARRSMRVDMPYLSPASTTFSASVSSGSVMP